MQRVNRIVCALLLAAASKLLAGERSRAQFQGVDYEVYRCKPAEVRLFWKDADGQSYGQFQRLQQALARSGGKLVFAMNAGIYKLAGGDYAPCGLHVEEGRVLNLLNRASGQGNFYLKPNVVFFVSGDKTGVMETTEFAAARNHAPDRAAIGTAPSSNGRMHPAFRADSASLHHRNGVGIAPNGDVLFAITEFSGRQSCEPLRIRRIFPQPWLPVALFLDGDISAMWDSDGCPAPAINTFAAILSVTETES